MPRLFISIDLPEQIRDQIADTYMALRGVRWTDENQLHLTLRFIGDVDSVQQKRVVNALRLIKMNPFSLSLRGVGVFPPRKDPKILWIGIEGNEDLMRFQAKIERSLVEAGCQPEERKFHPHITIARLSDVSTERLGEFITTNNLFTKGPIAVNEFFLYQSILRKEGAHHIKEISFPLIGEKA